MPVGRTNLLRVSDVNRFRLSDSNRLRVSDSSGFASLTRGQLMTTNELMRHLLVDIPETDRRHLVEIVDRNHAEQLLRKQRSRRGSDATADAGLADGDYSDEDLD